MNFSIQTATPLKPTPYVAAIIWPFFFSVGVQANEPLRLATTTSTENSGLLAELLPAFTKATGINVNVIAVGTGKALQIDA